MATTRNRRAPKAPAEPSKDGTAQAANALRGEHMLTLGGVEYLLRPSHEAITIIEQKTGGALLQLARDASIGTMPNNEMAIVATALIRAGASDAMTKNVGEKRIGELIFEEGTTKVTSRLALVLADASQGGRTAEGKAKASSAS
jgi:hypothetical protein